MNKLLLTMVLVFGVHQLHSVNLQDIKNLETQANQSIIELKNQPSSTEAIATAKDLIRKIGQINKLTKKIKRRDLGRKYNRPMRKLNGLFKQLKDSLPSQEIIAPLGQQIAILGTEIADHLPAIDTAQDAAMPALSCEEKSTESTKQTSTEQTSSDDEQSKDSDEDGDEDNDSLAVSTPLTPASPKSESSELESDEEALTPEAKEKKDAEEKINVLKALINALTVDNYFDLIHSITRQLANANSSKAHFSEDSEESLKIQLTQAIELFGEKCRAIREEIANRLKAAEAEQKAAKEKKDAEGKINVLKESINALTADNYLDLINSITRQIDSIEKKLKEAYFSEDLEKSLIDQLEEAKDLFEKRCNEIVSEIDLRRDAAQGQSGERSSANGSVLSTIEEETDDDSASSSKSEEESSSEEEEETDDDSASSSYESVETSSSESEEEENPQRAAPPTANPAANPTSTPTAAEAGARQAALKQAALAAAFTGTIAATAALTTYTMQQFRSSYNKLNQVLAATLGMQLPFSEIQEQKAMQKPVEQLPVEIEATSTTTDSTKSTVEEVQKQPEAESSVIINTESKSEEQEEPSVPQITSPEVIKAQWNAAVEAGTNIPVIQKMAADNPGLLRAKNSDGNIAWTVVHKQGRASGKYNYELLEAVRPSDLYESIRNQFINMVKTATLNQLKLEIDLYDHCCDLFYAKHSVTGLTAFESAKKVGRAVEIIDFLNPHKPVHSRL